MSVAEPCMIVIFGATGDLTRRKIIPALFHLFRRGVIAQRHPIVGVSRRALPREAFIESLRISEFIPEADRGDLERFRALLRCEAFSYTAESAPAFGERLAAIERETGCGPNRVIYLALPAIAFESTAVQIWRAGLLDRGGWRRICFEKPFGTDLASAHELNRQVTAIFDEHEIYRIDHYLGKELVRNLLALRFANPLFEEIWSNTFIDHVQITVAESLGVEGRGDYYDRAGAIRDMLQNHLLQILALIAMERPRTLDATALRDEKVKVLRALQRPRAECVVIGQYGPGTIDGRPVPGYREEDGVDPRSRTETSVAVEMRVETDRWRGVPFFVRTGKRLAQRAAEVHIALRDTAHDLFGGEGEARPHPNLITVRIQPHEGIAVTFNLQAPGAATRLTAVTMEHCHRSPYGLNTPEAYEILLQEILAGDQTLFPRWDFVEMSWRHIDALLPLCEPQRDAFPNYAAGTTGPAAADALLRRSGREWILGKDIRRDPPAEERPSAPHHPNTA